MIDRVYAAARTWWRQLPRGWHSPIWPAAAAMVTTLILLVSFHRVVSGVVEQAALRRQIALVSVEDELPCNLLGDERARAHCHLLVRADTARAATQPVLGVASGERIATR